MGRSSARALRLVVVALVLAACGDSSDPQAEDVELANPASVHCEDQGGTVELVETDDGQVGICVLEDGRECEEWAYYRRGECVPAGRSATTTVEVYLTNEALGDPCGEVFPVRREVSTEEPIVGAVEALLAGPTAQEREQGYGGWFSDATAGSLRSVGLRDGTVEVDLTDLRPIIPNASTSCGSAGLLAQLDRTLLQFPEVDATRYSIDGSTDDFYGWLQYEPPGG